MRCNTPRVARVGPPKFFEGTAYALTMVNQGNQAWTMYVYQKAPDPVARNLFSLAWLASPYLIRVGDQVRFTWTIDYSFVWDALGLLKPGVNFRASGAQPCSPDGNNITEFDRLPGPGLSIPVKGDPAGSLVINDNKDVPASEFSVGIGMSGAGTFVQQAGPSLKHQFTPTPAYYVAAGEDTHVGDILDIESITPTAEVRFPPDVYALAATLEANNEWTIAPD